MGIETDKLTTGSLLWQRVVVDALVWADADKYTGKHIAILWAAERIEALKARVEALEKPVKFDEVWKKHCELNPLHDSSLTEIQASLIYTAGFAFGRSITQQESE